MLQPDMPQDLERLMRRHGEIQRAMRRPGGIRITVERELHAIREVLKNFPAALEPPQREALPLRLPTPAAARRPG